MIVILLWVLYSGLIKLLSIFWIYYVCWGGNEMALVCGLVLSIFGFFLYIICFEKVMQSILLLIIFYRIGLRKYFFKFC